MVWFLGILFAYSGMLAMAPIPTLKVSGVFAVLLAGLYVFATMTLGGGHFRL